MVTKIIINGSFDILHYGHLCLLEFASHCAKNPYITVLIDSDERIRSIKGHDRPINNLHDRMALLKAIKYVNHVDSFNTDEELNTLIKNYAPDIMVKGSDYKDKPIIGAEFCKEIIFYDRVPNYSTTGKIQSLIDRRLL